MRGNYRYEEERYRGRGNMPRGFGERGRDREWDEDDLEQERGRFASGPDYRREWDRGRSSYDDDYRRYRGSYGRPSGTRESSFEGYDEDEYPGASRGYGMRGGEGYGPRDEGRGDRYGSRDEARSWTGGRRDEMQADGWSGEPDEMRWNRQQGLYGSSEYGGYLSSQRMQRESQSHVGKGPKGWQRSDERIREEVNEALTRHPEIDATEIEVRVQGGEVVLTGTVTDRRAKRKAEEVAERVFGTKDVQNQIKVQKREGAERFSERDVTRTPDREVRGSTSEESQYRRQGPTTGTTTNR